MAKIGPAGVIAREARILGECAGSLALAVPALVAAGAGWVVMEEIHDSAARWDERQYTALLADLARLHDALEGSPALAGGWLRDPSGSDLRATLSEGGDRAGVELPSALARIADEPGPIAAILARSQPITLVHGDPTLANNLPDLARSRGRDALAALIAEGSDALRRLTKA